MAWQKNLHNPNQQVREEEEYWKRRWRQKACFQSLDPITRLLQGAAPFFFNSKWLWNRKESTGVWFSVSGTEHYYTEKQRMVGPALGRQRHQGKHRVSTGQHGMYWAGAYVLYQSGVQKTNPNFWKALSFWDIGALTASSPELVLKHELHFFWCTHPPMLPMPGLCLHAGKHWLLVPQQAVPSCHLCMGVFYLTYTEYQ